MKTDTLPLALAVRLMEQDFDGLHVLIQTVEPADLLMSSLKWNAMFLKKAGDSMQIDPRELARKLINEIEMAEYNAD
jgi:hypothetical protein